MYLLEAARDMGVEFIPAELIDVDVEAGRVTGATLSADGETLTLKTDAVVLSPGPHLGGVLKLLDIALPVVVEKHIKISIADHLTVVPRSAPLIIWTDPTQLPWSEDEREALAQDDETRHLLETFPAGVHGRPVGGGDQVLMYWTYDCEAADTPEFPLTWDPYLPDLTLRGMAVMVPGLTSYFDPDAEALCRRWLLYQDAGEPAADRTARGSGRIYLLGVFRLRHHGGVRFRRTARRTCHWWGVARLRWCVSAGSIR